MPRRLDDRADGAGAIHQIENEGLRRPQRHRRAPPPVGHDRLEHPVEGWNPFGEQAGIAERANACGDDFGNRQINTWQLSLRRFTFEEPELTIAPLEQRKDDVERLSSPRPLQRMRAHPASIEECPIESCALRDLLHGGVETLRGDAFPAQEQFGEIVPGPAGGRIDQPARFEVEVDDDALTRDGQETVALEVGEKGEEIGDAQRLHPATEARLSRDHVC